MCYCHQITKKKNSNIHLLCIWSPAITFIVMLVCKHYIITFVILLLFSLVTMCGVKLSRALWRTNRNDKFPWFYSRMSQNVVLFFKRLLNKFSNMSFFFEKKKVNSSISLKFKLIMVVLKTCTYLCFKENASNDVPLRLCYIVWCYFYGVKI